MMKNLKQITVIRISIVVLAILVAFLFIILIDEISKVQNKVFELDERIKQLEVDCKLYEHDFNQLKEYREGALYEYR